MKIYFAGAIRAGRDDRELYLAIITHMGRYGTVLTEHIGDEKLSLLGDAGETASIYERDMAWLRSADVVIAEISTPSLGVGYELSKIEDMKKQALCLYRPQEGRRLSAMIAGNKAFKIVEYSVLQEALQAIDAFFGELHGSP
jgi:2'-deoxynucleoside 5'-phosphate N-hydrolase